MTDKTPDLERPLPTKRQAAVFRFKSFVLQSRRLVTDRVGPTRARKFSATDKLTDLPIAGTSKTKLWTVVDPRERYLNAGKIQNLRLAAECIDGLEIPPGETFSFWKHIGRATRRRGFVAGRELREGCIIPNVGGGLCQLSNALYNAALDANFEIVERHPHTQAIPNSHATPGRDATVFWNYIDLRIRSHEAFRVEAKLTSEALDVRFRAAGIKPQILHKIENRAVPAQVNNCVTCGQGDCFRSIKVDAPAIFGKTAFLVDEYSPEFDQYIQASHTREDMLLVPLDGRRYRKANYRWSLDGFSRARQSFGVTAARSLTSRRLASQGALRQRNLLRMYERLADDYAKKLTYDCLHLVVDQHLLPFLWKRGHLGGRTFDVLMSAFPMSEIEKRLNRAYRLHPESSTLGDFRADQEIVNAEAEAISNARRIITVHTGIANLFPHRAVRLDWRMPDAEVLSRRPHERPRILFPASTLGRKGCYELRVAIRGLDIELMLGGPVLESEDFWDGVNVVPLDVATADLVVLPAYIEHSPRRLLKFAATGLPVIATAACGVTGVDGVTIVEMGDAAELRERIVEMLERGEE